MKTAFLTLDWEFDYGGSDSIAARKLLNFVYKLRENNVPITIFVEGRLMLHDYAKAIISSLANDSGVSFGIHCWDHRNYTDNPDDILRTIEIYTSLFRSHPRMYRAGNYRISNEIVDVLASNSIKYDASLIYGRTDFSLESSFRSKQNLEPLQLSTITRLKIPASAVYLISLYPIIRVATFFGIKPTINTHNDQLIINCHMTDLLPQPLSCILSKSLLLKPKILLLLYGLILAVLPKEYPANAMVYMCEYLRIRHGATKYSKV